MDKNIEKTEELRDIVATNPDLKERIVAERWSISYNKRADFVLMGGNFPEGSFYYPIDDSGLMLRIDKDNKLYGFAVENAKRFATEFPELKFALQLAMHPVRTKYFIFPAMFLVYHMVIGIDAIVSVSNYVAGKAAYVRTTAVFSNPEVTLKRY